METSDHRRPTPRDGSFIPLFWRLFIPNATVLSAASVVLMLEPANGRVVALGGGLLLMLTANLLLMRRTIAPLSRLISVMEQIDPLEPGRRLPPAPTESEVSALTDTFNRMLERLETERRESGYRAVAAQEAERRRVARELHDEIGQQLTALVLDLDRLAQAAPPDSREMALDAVRATKRTLQEVRVLAHRLRPEVLDELGLVPALRNLCDRFEESSRLVVRRSLERTLPPLPAEAELVVYRVAQESLTNVTRHARASGVSVTLQAADGFVELTVTDDGIGVPDGLDAMRAGGVRGMRERALAVGGRLDVAAEAAGGTALRLRVPTVSSDA